MAELRYNLVNIYNKNDEVENTMKTIDDYIDTIDNIDKAKEYLDVLEREVKSIAELNNKIRRTKIDIHKRKVKLIEKYLKYETTTDEEDNSD